MAELANALASGAKKQAPASHSPSMQTVKSHELFVGADYRKALETSCGWIGYAIANRKPTEYYSRAIT
jgi:hypothetical protein